MKRPTQALVYLTLLCGAFWTFSSSHSQELAPLESNTEDFTKQRSEGLSPDADAKGPVAVRQLNIVRESGSPRFPRAVQSNLLELKRSNESKVTNSSAGAVRPPAPSPSGLRASKDQVAAGSSDTDPAVHGDGDGEREAQRTPERPSPVEASQAPPVRPAESQEQGSKRPVSGVPGSNPLSLRPEHEMLVFVMTNLDTLRTLGRSMWGTWMKTVRSEANILIYATACDRIAQLRNTSYPLDPAMEANIRCLPGSLNPVEKEFAAWADIADNFKEGHKWFVKVNQFSYLNARPLMSALADMNPAYPIYAGKPALGRPEDQELLKLEGKPYCMGMTYFWSEALLAKIHSELSNCASRARTNFSDVEIGRCVHQYAWQSCIEPVSGLLVQMPRPADQPLVASPNAAPILPDTPRSQHFDALAVFPFLSGSQLYKFHNMIVRNLRPLFQTPDLLDDESRNAVLHSCVHNPSRQFEHIGESLKECPINFRIRTPALPRSGYVLTMSKRNRKPQQIYGMTLTTVPFEPLRSNASSITSIDVGYLNTIRGILTQAIKDKQDRILLLDDDVILHCDFEEQLMRILREERCSAHLFSDQQGGVLMLGAQEFDDFSRETIQEDKSNAMQYGQSDQCYNWLGKSAGSFAGIYHKAVFQAIIDWIDENAKSAKPAPFYTVLTALSDKGHLVRVADPPLAIQDLSKAFPLSGVRTPTLTLTQRSKLLKWNLIEYCDYMELM